jgi:hypothetical protein
MKEKIFAALKTKFVGVSEAILSRVADKLAKTVTKEDEVATAVEGVTFQNVLESYGDSRATEATQSSVINYEKKHGLKDGLKVTGGEPKKEEPKEGGEETTPAWAKVLIDSNKALTEKVNAMEGDTITKSRKQQLEAIVGKLPESLRKPYARISLNDKSEEEFTALIAEVTTEVEGLSTELGAKSTVFNRPLGGGAADTKEPSAEEVEEVVSQMNM